MQWTRMDLESWLRRIENLHPVKWDLGLARVGEVGRRLGVLKPAPRTFLVAGTNGKGSTCEAITRLCLARGLSVGKSTSPHLIRFNERIEVDGIAASDEEICGAFERIDAAREDITLSYFEFGALAAMLVFCDRRVDVAVLEIGLGGRLDAMNIVDPDISVITRIAMDHESWLGNDRETIAREKAGILRLARPAVLADDEPPRAIGAIAAELESPLYRINQEFGVEKGQFRVTSPTGARFEYCAGVPQMPLQSILAAIQAVTLLDLTPTQQDVNSLLEVPLPGRFYRVPATRQTIVDVAHNPDGALWLAKRLEEVEYRRCHAVVGMYRDKDREGVFKAMVPKVGHWYVTRVAEDRAATQDELASCLARMGGSVQGTYDKVARAYDDALMQSEPGDLILVFGSFPIVGEVLLHLGAAVG